MIFNTRLALQLLVTGAALLASPAHAVTQSAAVSANVVKPLTLTKLQDFSLGTIALGAGTWSGAKIGITSAGVFTCSSSVVCTGTSQTAIFNVQGTNKMVVRITVPNVTLVNQSDPTKTLQLTVDNPGQVTLTSSGVPGNDFNIGGSITVNSTTPGGTYKGTMNVTADYQ